MRQASARKGPEAGNANYYYSLVRMETTGNIVFGGTKIDVSGLSWMDHEFGTSALSGDAVGWDWFAVTLDNDVVLMFAEIRTKSGAHPGHLRRDAQLSPMAAKSPSFKMTLP